MNRLTRRTAWKLAMAILAVVVASMVFSAPAGAQDDALEVEKVTPYTGPPIFLDEPEPQPPATLVEKSVFTDKYDDGTVRVERQIARYSDDHRAADGFYREYYPNGQLFVEGEYRDGAQHGQWTYWHENGEKNRTATYKNGRPDGNWEVYRADGTLAAKRSYKEGRRDGTWLYYDETGKQTRGEEHYVDGKADGVWKAWFPSGQLRRQSGFKQGQRDGKLIEWDDEGNKRVDATYVDGKPHGTATVWTADGRKFVQEYDHGKIVSRSEE